MNLVKEVLNGIGIASALILAFLVSVYALLILGGVLAHWMADIFMFGWRLW